MKLLNREALKYIGIFAVILVLAGIVYVGSFYFSPEQKAERQIIKEFEELERKMRQDPYGGETPEETLELFISALEAGDLELASKYFSVPDQEKQLLFLRGVEDRGNIMRMIEEGKSLEFAGMNDSQDKAFFVIVNENNFVEVEVVLVKNELSGLWKILEL